MAVLSDISGSLARLCTDEGSGATFTIASDAYVMIQIYVASGQAITGTEVIYPVIQLAEDTYTGHTPYAMTNGELTEAVTLKKGTFTVAGSLATGDIHVTEKNGIVSISGAIYAPALSHEAYTNLGVISGVSLPSTGNQVRFAPCTSLPTISVAGRLSSNGNLEIYLYGSADSTPGTIMFNFSYMV